LPVNLIKMAQSYHWEACRKQERLNRFRGQNGQDEQAQAPMVQPDDAAYKKKMEQALITDPGQFNQIRSVHSWTGTERNRRFHDYSVAGPIRGGSVRELRREANFRESCFATDIGQARGRVIPRHEFVPADPCFRKCWALLHCRLELSSIPLCLYSEW